MGSLVPLSGELPNEQRALAEVLRDLFAGLSVGVRRYAVRRHRDAGSISRFLNGTRIPPWDFIFDLINDVAELRGGAPTVEMLEHLRSLHRRALAAGGSASHRVQLLEAELELADRQARRSAVREQALEDALLDAQRRTADLEVRLRQLEAAEHSWTPEHASIRIDEDRSTEIRSERDQLKEQVEILREELKDAHTRRLMAEQKCEELERQLSTAEMELQADDATRARSEAAAETEHVAALEEELRHLRQRVATLGENSPPEEKKKELNTGLGERRINPQAAKIQSLNSAQASRITSHLNDRYGFQNFIADQANQLALNAAVAVAETPGKTYNPLFLYGDFGIGKTHLLHAIGHRARKQNPDTKVGYVSSEEFANEFIKAVRDGEVDSFRRWYRTLEILLVDDIQFLASKDMIQEEFLHTFNALHSANKQIVVSCDRPPKQLVTFAEQLRNRFASGLVAKISASTPETRVAILHIKAAQDKLDTSPEILEYIATQSTLNIRELEGALSKISAFAKLNVRPLDIELAREALRDTITDGSVPRVNPHAIMSETALYFGLTVDHLCGTSRSRVLVTARQIAMHLCRELTELSNGKIASLFGGRGSDTVVHADRKIRVLMNERQTIHNQVNEITARLLQS